jgi:hypothetical protein
MAKRQRKNHLNAEQKRFICRMFAEFAAPSQVQAEFEKAFGFQLALSTIYHYRDAELWRPVILDMRKALVNHLGDLPICSKYWRLKQLHELFESENRYRIVRYSGKSEIPIEEKPVGELRQILALAAEELGELRKVLEHQGGEGGPVVHRITFSDGSPVPAVAVPVPAAAAGGTGR